MNARQEDIYKKHEFIEFITDDSAISSAFEDLDADQASNDDQNQDDNQEMAQRAVTPPPIVPLNNPPPAPEPRNEPNWEIRSRLVQ